MRGAALADCRVQVLRGMLDSAALQRRWVNFAALGPVLWAQRADLSDGEKSAHGMRVAERVSRFRLRALGTALDIRPSDRLQLVASGAEFDILGVKDVPGRRLIEITARERADLVPA